MLPGVTQGHEEEKYLGFICRLNLRKVSYLCGAKCALSPLSEVPYGHSVIGHLYAMPALPLDFDLAIELVDGKG
jgi:hypothetical protein